MIEHKIIIERDYSMEFFFRFLFCLGVNSVLLILPISMTFVFFIETGDLRSYYIFIYFEILISWLYSVYIISQQDMKIESRKVKHIIKGVPNELYD